jgi:bifunctional DNA-binding transcriptional regulator/antitoxin component of YhaV-PrlF toxin-antitoxin module
MNKTWTITLDDEGILPLPKELLIETGWKEGDCLQWIDNCDGSWTLVKEDLTTFINNGIINNE